MIKQIHENDRAFPKEYHGKWICVESTIGSDSWPVNRYLQADGNWDRVTHYFDEQYQVQVALAEGKRPDFTMSVKELIERASMSPDYLQISGGQHSSDDDDDW